MPANGVIGQGSRGFREDYGESDERKRLPQLRRLKPNEQSEERRARGGKEPAKSTLLSIVAMRRQLCREIVRRSENGQGQEPHAHVRMFGRFEMQVDDSRAVKGQEAEQRILDLQMARLEGA